jgi:hypothetical protein
MTAYKLGLSITISQYLRWVSPLLLAFAGTASAGQQLQAYDNYDLTGTTIRTLQNVDLQGCAEACQSNNQCQAFSYDKWGHQCALKQSAGSLRFEPRSVSGVAANAPLPPTSNGPIAFDCTKGKRFDQEDYKAIKSSTFEQCRKNCQIDKDCSAFTHSDRDRLCKLFTTADQTKPDEAYVIGIKRQFEVSSDNVSSSCTPFARHARAEEDTYRAARGDVAMLRSYVSTCSICDFAKDATLEIE